MLRQCSSLQSRGTLILHGADSIFPVLARIAITVMECMVGLPALSPKYCGAWVGLCEIRDESCPEMKLPVSSDGPSEAISGGCVSHMILHVRASSLCLNLLYPPRSKHKTPQRSKPMSDPSNPILFHAPPPASHRCRCMMRA